MSWQRFLTPTTMHRRLGLVCLGAGSYQGSASPRQPRQLDCFAAVILTAGHGWLRFGSSLYSLQPSNLFWLAPGITHSYWPESPSWSESWVLFDGVAAEAYEQLGLISRTNPVVRLAEPEPVRRSFARAGAACRGEFPHADPVTDASAAVHDIVVTVGRHRSSNDSDHSNAVVDSVRRHAFEDMTVRQHAQRLGITMPSLRRSVVNATGHHPREYITLVRLNLAKDLLAGSALSVAAIARRVGYDDPAYFSRVFNRRVGLSPIRFREQQRRDERP